jgi:hypothetical protein
MTVEEVVELIRSRRNLHLRSPIGENAGDPLRWSEGGLHRAIIQEYDTLLDEIQRGETNAEGQSDFHEKQLPRSA